MECIAGAGGRSGVDRIQGASLPSSFARTLSWTSLLTTIGYKSPITDSGSELRQKVANSEEGPGCSALSLKLSHSSMSGRKLLGFAMYIALEVAGDVVQNKSCLFCCPRN